MVNAARGVLIECDPEIKQFILHLNHRNGQTLIIQDLDETHLLGNVDLYESDLLTRELDSYADKNSYTRDSGNSNWASGNKDKDNSKN